MSWMTRICSDDCPGVILNARNVSISLNCNDGGFMSISFFTSLRNFFACSDCVILSSHCFVLI